MKKSSCYAVITPFKCMADEMVKFLYDKGYKNCATHASVREDTVGVLIYPDIKKFMPYHQFMLSHENARDSMLYNSIRISTNKAKSIIREN